MIFRIGISWYIYTAVSYHGERDNDTNPNPPIEFLFINNFWKHKYSYPFLPSPPLCIYIYTLYTIITVLPQGWKNCDCEGWKNLLWNNPNKYYPLIFFFFKLKKKFYFFLHPLLLSYTHWLFIFKKKFQHQHYSTVYSTAVLLL